MKWHEINDALKACRVRAGLSQDDLARRLGFSQAWVSKMERGQAEPSMSNAAEWLTACGAGSLHILIGDDEDLAVAAAVVQAMRRDRDAAVIVRALLSLSDRARPLS
jgi:transcriptional regulator with XRE-family HTH domain